MDAREISGVLQTCNYFVSDRKILIVNKDL